MQRRYFIAVASLGVSGFLGSSSPAAAQAPTLGTAKSFAVLAGQTVTNTGPTVLSEDLGVWPGTAITGFPPGIVMLPGTTHAGDATAQQAQADVTAAYVALAGQPCGTSLTGMDLGGLTLTKGVYCFASSAQLTGALVLDMQGDSNAFFDFQIGSTLTTASNSSVTIINGGPGCNPNVFWQVGSSATLGTNTSFHGSILALTSIALNTGTKLAGRALARNGSVTLDANNVVIPAQCLCVTPASATALGSGCGATLTSSPPVMGQTATVQVQSGIGSSPGFLLASATGAPVTMIRGCSTFLDFATLEVIKSFTTSPGGAATFNFQVPATLLRCADQFVFQAVILSPTGPLSFGATSNGVFVTIGI